VPIYEYRCPNGHTFELFQRMTDAPASTCEVCGAGPVEKVLFPVAVHFKGSGFYATDYGRGSRKPKEGESAPAGKESGGTADAGASEKKPAGGESSSSSASKTDS
jgi:putative FmdB family regulatory protein